MFTAESLLNLAAEAEQRYESLLAQFPPGTVNAERNQAHKAKEEYLACATWMAKNNIGPSANVGPFETTHVTRGQRVKIRKGAVIYSTKSSVPQEGIVSKKAQVVTVNRVSKGYLDYQNDPRNPRVVAGAVHWAGANGYWRWTDINNIDLG